MSGELDFSVGLDVDQLRRDAFKVKSQFTNIGKHAEIEGSRIDKTFRRVGAGLISYFGTQQLFSFAKAVAMTRGEFQQLEVAFTTMLKSKAKADALMVDIVDFAATTPYELKDVGKGAKQLLAFQVPAKEITSTLRQIGDLAAGVGAPLNDLVSIYGKVKAKGKIQAEEMNLFLERGIPLVSELADKYKVTEGAIYDMASKGKIGFADLQGVMSKLTGEGGMFFNLMDEQSKTITGQISNLADAFDSMLNEIGQNSEGVIEGAIDGAKFLVENYQDVAKILGTLIATYGAYKTALIASVAIQKAAAIAGNVKAWFQLARGIKSAKDAQILFNLTSKANPYALIATAIVGAVTALVLFSEKTSQAKINAQMLADVTSEVSAKVEQESSILSVYKRRLEDTEPGSKERIRLVKELNKRYPDLLGNIDGEKASIDQLSGAMNSYIGKLEQTIKLKVLKSNLEKLTTEQTDVDTKYNSNDIDANERYQKTNEIAAKRKVLLESLKFQTDLVEYGKSVADLLKEKNQLEKEIAEVPTLVTQLGDTPQDFSEYEKGQKQRSKLFTDSEIKKSYADYVKSFDETTNEYKVKINRLKQIEREIEASGKVSIQDKEVKTSSSSKKDYTSTIKKQEKELEEAARQLAFAASQAEIDGMKEGLDKALAQNELNHQIKLDQLEAQKAERLQQFQEHEETKYLKSGGKKESFKPTTVELPKTDQAYFNELEKGIKATYNKAIEEALTDDDVSILKEKDRLEKLALEFENFQQKRLRVTEEYNAKIADLQQNNSDGEYDSNIEEAGLDKDEALASIDKEMASREISFVIWTEKITGMGLKKLVSTLQTANKMLDSSSISNKEKAILRAKISVLQKKVKIAKARSKGDADDEKKSWGDTLKVMNEVNQSVSDIISNFDGLEASTKSVLTSATNIAGGVIAMITGIQLLATASAEGIKTVEKASVILAIIGAAIQILTAIFSIFKSNNEAQEAHEAALEEITKRKIQHQLEYNKLLREQLVLMEDSVSIFGEKEIEKATSFVDAYTGALKDYYEVLKGNAPGEYSGLWARLAADRIQRHQDAYDRGIGSLFEARVVTGSTTVSSGFLGLGSSQADTYSAMLDVYPDLVDGENRLNVERAKSILATDKMSEADKELLETLISLEEEVKKNEEALEDYLSETFGSLGDGLMDSIVGALQTGEDAWENFGKVGAEILEDLGKQIAYSLFFADMFKDLENELKGIYSSGLSEEEIANSAAQLIESFYNGIGGQMDVAQDFMQQWDDQLGSFDLWSDGSEREATEKGFASMSQDSADELNGRFTVIQGHTYEINQGVKLLAENSSSILTLLSGIESNTSRLGDIQKSMNSVKAGIENINTKGIKIK